MANPSGALKMRSAKFAALKSARNKNMVLIASCNSDSLLLEKTDNHNIWFFPVILIFCHFPSIRRNSVLPFGIVIDSSMMAIWLAVRKDKKPQIVINNLRLFNL
jgi:hypothetical protein